MICPRCDYTRPWWDFEVVGACEGNLICPLCSCEFDSVTMKKHEPSKCCDNIGISPITKMADEYAEQCRKAAGIMD